jgi:hypothetical protein
LPWKPWLAAFGWSPTAPPPRRRCLMRYRAGRRGPRRPPTRSVPCGSGRLGRTKRTLALRCCSLRPGLRSLRGQRSVAQPGTVRGLENYPGRGLTWRGSCQSSPAAPSASWMRCHAAPSDSSSRMRTCPRSSGICVPRPRCLATAATSSSARLPGRITWTTIAVSGTRADRSRGPPTHPARATRFRRHRPGTSGHLRQAASSKKKDLAGRLRLRWVEVSARRGGSVKLRGISSDRSCGSCGRPLPSLS